MISHVSHEVIYGSIGIMPSGVRLPRMGSLSFGLQYLDADPGSKLNPIDRKSLVARATRTMSRRCGPHVRVRCMDYFFWAKCASIGAAIRVGTSCMPRQFCAERDQGQSVETCLRCESFQRIHRIPSGHYSASSAASQQRRPEKRGFFRLPRISTALQQAALC
jgi:hypothetical protein